MSDRSEGSRQPARLCTHVKRACIGRHDFLKLKRAYDKEAR